MKVAQELEESHIPRQSRFADASKHSQVGLQQGKEALGSVLMHLTASIFLLRVVDILVEVARERPIAAGRVGVQPTAGLDGEVHGLLYGLHGEIARRLDDDRPLATDPGDNRGPVFLIVPPTGLAFLAAPTRAASQRFLPALVRLALLASRVIQVIRLNGAFQLAADLIRDGGMP